MSEGVPSAKQNAILNDCPRFRTLGPSGHTNWDRHARQSATTLERNVLDPAGLAGGWLFQENAVLCYPLVRVGSCWRADGFDTS